MSKLLQFLSSNIFIIIIIYTFVLSNVFCRPFNDFHSLMSNGSTKANNYISDEESNKQQLELARFREMSRQAFKMMIANDYEDKQLQTPEEKRQNYNKNKINIIDTDSVDSSVGEFRRI
jgi:hypothetical protein